MQLCWKELGVCFFFPAYLNLPLARRVSLLRETAIRKQSFGASFDRNEAWPPRSRNRINNYYLIYLLLRFKSPLFFLEFYFSSWNSTFLQGPWIPKMLPRLKLITLRRFHWKTLETRTGSLGKRIFYSQHQICPSQCMILSLSP